MIRTRGFILSLLFILLLPSPIRLFPQDTLSGDALIQYVTGTDSQQNFVIQILLKDGDFDTRMEIAKGLSRRADQDYGEIISAVYHGDWPREEAEHWIRVILETGEYHESWESPVITMCRQWRELDNILLQAILFSHLLETDSPQRASLAAERGQALYEHLAKEQIIPRGEVQILLDSLFEAESLFPDDLALGEILRSLKAYRR